MVQIQTNVAHAQAFGCLVYVQLGSVGITIGRSNSHPIIRFEMFTLHKVLRLVIEAPEREVPF